ncbi:FecCD family ABC transporter permease [Paenibacillus pasadenensis]|uniref:Fe-bacillibactin uptake system FeuC n=1 Tax=Paenibacillus pasadenensis TaxID=217090 RepID=A0A2N5N053_9BACL|nr:MULTISPECIES: iron ABC transporter permease [Paenibacillus]PLT43706.1 Fe-bacillibactin uptake system FeuC [Paenibacillus pasadenensis]
MPESSQRHPDEGNSGGERGRRTASPPLAAEPAAGSGSRRAFGLALAGAAAAIMLIALLGVTTGEFALSVPDALRTLLGGAADADERLVVFGFRLPRIVLAALVGVSLGAAGAAMQSLTRNGLADPGILGINAGASLAVVLFMLALRDIVQLEGLAAVMTMPLYGTAGGLAAGAIIFALARSRGSLDPQKLLLVGIAVTSGFGAATLYISLKMNPQDFERAAVWLSGSLNSANWLYVLAVLPWVLLLLPALWAKSRMLDLMRLSDDTLSGLGVALKRERRTLLLLSAGLVAASVAVSGSIGFVGLIAPHMAARLAGLSHRRLLPLSALLGAALVMAGDYAGRTAFSPSELPAGIVISIIGAPYFVWLLIRQKTAR